MPKGLLRFFALLAFCLVCLGKPAESQIVTSRHFPGRGDTVILCWSIPEEGAGIITTKIRTPRSKLD
jgi:hypothetical protein